MNRNTQGRPLRREASGVRAACCRFGGPDVFESGSKLRALQTLRDAVASRFRGAQLAGEKKRISSDLRCSLFNSLFAFIALLGTTLCGASDPTADKSGAR